MDNVNFEAKTDWKQDETVYPADANRWEKGIKDCADLVNLHNETDIPDIKKIIEQLSQNKLDKDLANLPGSAVVSYFNYTSNALYGTPTFVLKFSNGLIIQGFKSSGNRTTNWPVAFTTVVLSVLFGDNPLADNEGSAITGYTLTNVSNAQKYARRSPWIVGIGI